MKRFLIFNADDFGRSRKENEAIIETILNGLVRSTTVMANMPYASDICRVISNYSSVSVGIHINLVEGKPVLDPVKIPSLVDNNGYFVNKWKLLLRCLTGKARSEEVMMEVRAQIERVMNWIGKVSHLDSHQNIHIYPVIMPAILKVAKDMGIYKMRTQRTYSAQISFSYLIRWAVKTWRQRRIDREGILSPDLTVPMISFEKREMLSLDFFIKYFKRILNSSFYRKIEVCCHPGLNLLELELLSNPRINEFFDSMKVEIANFDVL